MDKTGKMLIWFLIFIWVFAIVKTLRAQQTHPIELKSPPLCSQCHDDWRKGLDHNRFFPQKHKFIAPNRKNTCNVCHRDSFCSDCHANKESLRPDEKFRQDPQRFMPHRGNYLVRHRIDGHLNPARCFTCHGRGNERRCLRCHRW